MSSAPRLRPVLLVQRLRLGFGAEYAITPHITAKAEYIYTSLGSNTYFAGSVNVVAGRRQYEPAARGRELQVLTPIVALSPRPPIRAAGRGNQQNFPKKNLPNGLIPASRRDFLFQAFCFSGFCRRIGRNGGREGRRARPRAGDGRRARRPRNAGRDSRARWPARRRRHPPARAAAIAAGGAASSAARARSTLPR